MQTTKWDEDAKTFFFGSKSNWQINKNIDSSISRTLDAIFKSLRIFDKIKKNCREKAVAVNER